MDTTIKEMAQRMSEDIIQKSGVHPSECACPSCQSMCRNAPCVGTAPEMYALMQHPEHADKLALTMNMASVRLGLPPIIMIAPIFSDEEKRCLFFEDGKCVLHEKGLKPLEGKLSNCRPDTKLIHATRMIH